MITDQTSRNASQPLLKTFFFLVWLLGSWGSSFICFVLRVSQMRDKMSKGGGGVHILSFFVSLFYFLFFIFIYIYNLYIVLIIQEKKIKSLTPLSLCFVYRIVKQKKQQREREREREALDGVVRKKDGKNIKALIAACTIEWSHWKYDREWEKMWLYWPMDSWECSSSILLK